jgi:hypothetical protein
MVAAWELGECPEVRVGLRQDEALVSTTVFAYPRELYYMCKPSV